MRKIAYNEIVRQVSALIDGCLKRAEDEAERRIESCLKAETEKNALWALKQISDNAAIARENGFYLCQDTGLAVFFIEYGAEIEIDGFIDDAINDAVRAAYRDARKSVADPLTRRNTGDNTPAVIHTQIVKGDRLKITYLAKGAGSENMSAMYFLTPSKGRDGIINAVADCVVKAGPNPCPPIIAGVGIGGDFEKAAILSKKALTRKTGEPNPDRETAQLEADILQKLNSLGIGAAGLGGGATALSVAVETYPTHIGMLPVAVNLQCHAVRHGSITL